jgi:hypothetical protein
MEALDAVEILKPTIEAINESYALYQQEQEEKQKQKFANGREKLQLTEEFPFSPNAAMPSTSIYYYYNNNNNPLQAIEETIKYR